MYTVGAINVVETILQIEKWNQFNKQEIASLCEKKEHFQLALEYYQDINDIRRVLVAEPRLAGCLPVKTAIRLDPGVSFRHAALQPQQPANRRKSCHCQLSEDERH